MTPFVFDVPAIAAQVSPAIKIIALLNATDNVRAQALLATKLHGCLFRHELDETILHGIRLVAAGKTWFTGPVLERLLTAASPPVSEPEPKTHVPLSALTPREQEVLRLLAQGLGNKAIAQALCLTEGTIEQHLKRIYRKLNINTRVEAATWFMRLQG
ncbi:MAG: response regulator transcription factor [Caldilineaceae bacterium]